MPQDVLALFDLDHTLLPHDTDEQWVEFLLARGVLERATFEAANRDLAARYARGEAGALEFTEFYLSTLAGRSVEDLDALRRDFIAERVLPVIPAAARALIERHAAQGHLVVVTTGVSRFLTEPIAQELGVDHLIATEPERKDGLYTGRVAGTPNMQDGKVERLFDWLQSRGQSLSDFRESWFYSDSQNDLPLLSHVTHPVAVNADPSLAAHARLSGWRQMSIR